MAKRVTRERKYEPKSILIADMSEFSKIEPDAHMQTFLGVVLDPIASMLPESQEANTWGDGIFALFDSPVECCRFALQLRDHFRRDFTFDGLPSDLSIRVAVHQGLVYRFDDPIRRVLGALGHEITLAARIEPVVPVGCVWATEQMKVAFESSGNKEIAFDEAGVVQLPKGYGKRAVFHTRRSQEPKYERATNHDILALRSASEAYLRELRLTKIKAIRANIVDRAVDADLLRMIEEMYSLAVADDRDIESELR